VAIAAAPPSMALKEIRWPPFAESSAIRGAYGETTYCSPGLPF
jgi:hypothetical protein